MDRIEFIHSIGYTEGTDTVNLLISFFDQYMLLFNLIEDINSVSYEQSYMNNISFILEYISEDAAKKNVNTIMQHNLVGLYGGLYLVSVESISATSIRIIITKQQENRYGT